MHRHFCVQYAYYPLWYAYHLCPICVHIYCMLIGHGRYAYQVLSALVRISDMDNCPLYKYRLCLICILPALVRISDTDNICIMDNYPCLICIPGQIVLGMHIVCVRYAYNKCVHISDTNDMRTRVGSMHIRHRNVYANHTWTIRV